MENRLKAAKEVFVSQLCKRKAKGFHDAFLPSPGLKLNLFYAKWLISILERFFLERLCSYVTSGFLKLNFKERDLCALHLTCFGFVCFVLTYKLEHEEYLVFLTCFVGLAS